MGLADNYRKASFRGVAFNWGDGDDEIGRRTVTHVYPLRDLPFTEDLGRKAGSFSMKGFVVGPDFMAQAKALIDACNLPGAGTLVHPLHGSLEVVCKTCRPTYRRGAVGMVEFSLTFDEEGENRYPGADDDYAQLASERAVSSLGTFKSSFVEAVNLSGPSLLTSSVSAGIKTALTMLTNAVSLLALPSKIVGQVKSELNAITAVVDSALDGGAAAIADLLGDSSEASLGTLRLGGLQEQSLAAALTMTGFGSASAATYGGSLQTINPTTATRARQASNQTSLTDLVRRISLAQGIQAAMDMELDSRQQALVVRDALVEKTDALMLDAGDSGDDEGYEALRQIQADVVTAMEQKAGALPEVGSRLVPPGVTPALVLAYRLYQDPDRESDLLARNRRIFHPGFLPGGESLEVLLA
mgnify:CR=1 FL=1